VETSNDEQKPYSLVRITGQNASAIGCIIGPNTILTTRFHIPQDLEPNSIEVTTLDNERAYKVHHISPAHPKIDLLFVEVQADTHSINNCVQLEYWSTPDGLSNNNDYYIYHPLFSERIAINLNEDGQVAFANPIPLEANLSGSPIFDRGGKVCAILTLPNNEIACEPGELGSAKGFAISVKEIADKVPQIKKINQYANSVISNLPDRDYRSFTGRNTEMARALELLRTQSSQDMTFLSGARGIGKTALAVELGYNCLSAYQDCVLASTDFDSPIFDTFIFVSLKNNSRFLGRYEFANQSLPDIGLARIIRVIGDVLKIPDLDRSILDRDFDRVHEALARRNALLIVDGLDGFTRLVSQEIVNFLHELRGNSSTKVIVTTRQEKTSYSSISLPPLTYEQSEELIRQRGNSDDLAIEGIVDLAAGLPTALIFVNCHYQQQKNLDYQKPDRSKCHDIGKFYFDRMVGDLKDSTLIVLECLSLFVTPAAKSSIQHIASSKNSETSVDSSLLDLEEIGLVFKSETGSGEAHYGISPFVREYVLEKLESISKDAPEHEEEMRLKWLEVCRNLASTFSDRAVIEAEWENLNEVLIWCEMEKKNDSNDRMEQKYKSIKDICLSIDYFLKDEKRWITRFCWWKYLVDKSLYFGGSSFRSIALVELIQTCLEMGDLEQAQKYFKRANERYDSADDSIKARLDRYKRDLEEMKKSAIDNLDVPIESLWTLG
jgi:hypothetical protein